MYNYNIIVNMIQVKNAVKRINEAKNAEDILKILLDDESKEPLSVLL